MLRQSAALAILLILFFSRSASAQARLTVLGTVRDSSTDLPIDRVRIYLPNDKSTETDASGHFQLKGVSTGTRVVLIRRIGYSPRAVRLTLQPLGPELDLGIIRLSPLAIELDSVRVEADLVRHNPRLADFYRRRHEGMGQYLTRQDIWKRNPFLTTDLLRSVAGITVSCSRGPCRPATMRGPRFCPMRVLLDGMPVDMSPDDIPPAWIAGIEVYKSAGFSPLELGSARCGIVAIWTGADDS